MAFGKMIMERMKSPSPGQLPVTDLGLKKQMLFRDKDTGEVIPVLKIQNNMAIIDTLLGKLEEGKKVYKQAMNDTGGDKAEASKLSNELAGGSYSVLWDRLTENKVVCALLVVCPPAKDKEAMYDNQDRVMWMIGQASEYMFKNVADIWTSRTEIGNQNQTHVYVRYPYHLWQSVEELGTAISTMNVGTHHFSASLSMHARKKVQWQEHVEHWQLECNGYKLPGIRKEDLQVLQAAANASCAEKLPLSSR